jgi:hypothetical protein
MVSLCCNHFYGVIMVSFLIGSVGWELRLQRARFYIILAVIHKLRHNSPNIHQTFTKHSPNIYQTFTKHSPNIHQTFTKHSPNIHQTFTKHSPNIHQTFTKHSREAFVKPTRTPRVRLRAPESFLGTLNLIGILSGLHHKYTID